MVSIKGQPIKSETNFSFPMGMGQAGFQAKIFPVGTLVFQRAVVGEVKGATGEKSPAERGRLCRTCQKYQDQGDNSYQRSKLLRVKSPGLRP